VPGLVADRDDHADEGLGRPARGRRGDRGPSRGVGRRGHTAKTL
jgi:hypothetical protein